MYLASETMTAELVDRVVELVRERLAEDQAIPVERFVRQYYAGVAYEDLAEWELVDLYGAALAHWNLARQRSADTPRIHVYNPQAEQHGWESTHTIIEIVTEDMPFLVDSVRMAVNREGLTNHLLVHPVMNLLRDDAGRLLEVAGPDDSPAGARPEAIMHLEVDRQTEPDVLDGLREELGRVLGHVRVSVADWQAMRDRMRAILADLKQSPPPIDAGDLEEGSEFLEWVDDGHFTYLGYREYELTRDEESYVLRSIGGSGLGILRDDGASRASQSFAALPPEAREMARTPGLLVITKGNTRSTVHRPGYLDYIGIKQVNGEGVVVGEHRFLGLYTSAAYNRNPRAIPLLRKKVATIMRRAGYPQNSHAGKALLNILETYPRDDLFQTQEVDVLQTALGILHLQERQRTRVFIHRDPYGRFFSCLVFVPRDRFNTEVRKRMAAILEESLGGGNTEYTVQLSESLLARVHYVVRVPPGSAPDYEVSDIEQRLVDVTRAWKDDLYDAMLEHCGEERGTRLYLRYGDAFRAAYRESYPARTAVHDAEKMESLADGRALAMSLYRPLEASGDRLQFKLFHPGAPVPLSDALPMLENMGLKVVDENPSKLKPVGPGVDRIWLHDFGMIYKDGGELDLDRVTEIFQQTFARVWGGDAEDDGFNRLVLRAGLSWREIVILRAYCKYLRQTGVTFSQEYMEQALAGNPDIARQLVGLFHARFDPSRDDAGRVADGERLVETIEASLDAVQNLDEDRILRAFLGTVLATLRTNFYQLDDARKPRAYLSLKFDSAAVPDLPQPRPMYEIFVYSPRVEGVHLRGAPVARGGLRWSDRREDFRTEILGLVKAQMVKNAVIVPMGSKGGFVAKALPSSGDREAVMAEVVECYRTFIRGLLDITDNLEGSDVVPPPRVTRHDGDDPYLVVAADKGTATFSDIANGIAEDYGFWLGDAFASGGSVGYDHKKMGITARGAWESVKRHFRELDLDIQSSDFTVVGVGDMAGDVFGNGMLLSRHIRLVGAFNHLHIFIDPDPNAETSYRERERLFQLPRSSWEDYDQSLLSTGGGIWPRSAKSITLSDEARAALGVEGRRFTPNELIQAMLKAPVDLLWNGGIGTYVKAAAELDSEVGDRANDALRVCGGDLRCRVVGEGGNLGLTQLGRIEYAEAGGRVNTDAIDNVGGVDCSDHEVNIKILLNAVVADGDMTRKQRNAVLVEMTDEVSRLVLRNNYLQTQCMSVAVAQSVPMLDVHARLMHALEDEVGLDREIEFLPTDEKVFERRSAGKGLSSPEMSVLVAYSKIALYQALLASALPEDPYLESELERYFPTPLRERFRDRMPGHRLRREIVSNELANGVVNRAGVSFTFRLSEETGAPAADIVRAYLAAREAFDVTPVWDSIEGLDNQVPAAAQTQMLLECRKLLERATRWLVRNRPRPLAMADTVAFFAPGVSTLAAQLPELMGESGSELLASRSEVLREQGVPAELADRIAVFTELFSALDVVTVARAASLPVEQVAQVYFGLGSRLDLQWLRDRILALPRDNRWQALARAAMRDDLYTQVSGLTAEVVRGAPEGEEPSAWIEAWHQRSRLAVERCQQVLGDLKSGPTPDFAMLSVAMGELRGLHQSDASGTAAEDTEIEGGPTAGKAA